jgi:YggT family protein
MNATFTILEFLFRIAALLFLVRVLLQATSANFYNPISQAIVKATDFVAKPLRTLLRPYRNFDIASAVIAWLINVAFFALVIYGINQLSVGVGTLLLIGLAQTVLVLIGFYLWTIVIIVVASFLAQGVQHPALSLLNQLVEPLIRPVRRILPTVGPLDFSPMAAMLGLWFLQMNVQSFLQTLLSTVRQ